MMSEIAPAQVSECGSEKVRFINDAEKKRLLSMSEQEGWMPVWVAIPGPQSRGRLGLVLEEAIERVLEARGACPPGITASCDSDASLSDQLYRARLLGAPGVALAIERLECIASRAGALDAEDSAVLRWWVMTSRERPLRLYFDRSDRAIGLYTAPVRFEEWLQNTDTDQQPVSVPPVNEQLASNLASLAQVAPNNAEGRSTELRATEDAIDEALAPIRLSTMAPAPPTPDERESTGDTAEMDATPFNTSVAELAATLLDSGTEEPVAEIRGEMTPNSEPSAEDTAQSPAQVTMAAEAQPEAEVPSAPATVRTSLHPEAPARWREWLKMLEQARGPKPLAVVEQLFVNAYVPLTDAALRKIAGQEAFSVLSTWSTSFARSYGDAFDALRLRGKRPMMVLDLVDVSMRLARLHGARSVQLILVDGMRFDLGMRVEEHMRAELGQQASMTERFVLWSALPSTTSTQLDLIARGPEGLKDFEAAVDTNGFVARGRAAATLRRVRAGHREVLKLDMVEARLDETGAASAEKLDELGVSVAQTLSSALAKLPPRTLALVFGDHGFWADPRCAEESKARHGGATPDEILVSAHAWLTGATH